MDKINSIYEVLDSSITDKIKKMMNQKVTDLIDTTNEEIGEFDKWFDSFMLNSDNIDGSSFIDIYMSNTIPVKNMEIDMRTPVGTGKGTIHIGEEVIVFRDNKDYEHEWEFIFDNDVDYIATVPYSEMVSYLSQDEKYFAILGTVTFEDEKYLRITYPIAILSNPKKLRLIEYGLAFRSFNGNMLGNNSEGDVDALITEYLLMTIRETIGNFIQIFSEINLALLNPYFEAVIMESATKIPIADTTPKKKNANNRNKRAKIRYVRRLRIGDIEEKCQKRGITRHAQIWYVTGHWRQYKSGKRVFIQGYWKGALRETKNSDTREREMMYALPDDEE